LIKWPQEHGSAQHLEWRQGPEAVQITQVVAADEPVRVLGQYVTPRGREAALATFIQEQAEELIRLLACKWLTDRQAQYMYRAVLLPITAYRIQGIPLLEQEVSGIQALLLRFVKHAFGVPSTSPSAFWFTRKGGRMMRLQAEVERQAIEMTVRLLSGKGCWEAGKLTRRIEAQVQTSLRFPGEMLAYPRLVATRKLEQGHGCIWWLYIAKILAAHGVAITVPERGR
ncbi:hypothetical protein H4R20_002484, partial [Coemansia guatemalensis]